MQGARRAHDGREGIRLMAWFKVDDHIVSHPASLKAGNAAMGLWVRLGGWLAMFPKQGDRIPKCVARAYGTKGQVRKLLEARLLTDDGDDYLLRRGMNICGSGLRGSFWAIERSDIRANIPERLRQAVYTRDGFACVECSSTDDLTLDHIHPWSRGGEDTYDNLRTLCRSCNARKGARI